MLPAGSGSLVLRKDAGRKARSAVKSFEAEGRRQQVVGLDKSVPLLDGSSVQYVNFDNAASTPPLVKVLDTINSFMPWYSSVHRGSGFKSQLSTQAYEAARQAVADFFGASSDQHVVIFGKNATEAINKLAYRMQLAKDDIILASLMEHHSNDLPWRPRAQVKRIKVNELGELDENHYDELLKEYAGRLKLVADSGGSNVTGHMPDIHQLAAKAHAAGAQILVDAAQLAPHRQVHIGKLDDPEHLDYIAVSAHKMYAPFGTGALIGRRDTFERGEPDLRGGGTIDLVTLEEVDWAEPPDCDEAGSPNVAGAVAFGASLKELKRIGMDHIARHEAELTAYTLQKLNSIPGIKIYGDSNPDNSANRLGVIPFNLKDMRHGLVAAILGTEWGIGVRSGCFCAHPYVTHILNLDKAQLKAFRDDVRRGDHSTMPGFVRISFGLYNTTEEVDRLIGALKAIAGGHFKGKYIQDKRTGDYIVEGWMPKVASYVSQLE